MPVVPSRPRRLLAVTTLVLAFAATLLAPATAEEVDDPTAAGHTHGRALGERTPAVTEALDTVDGLALDPIGAEPALHEPVPDDRYAMAGGCYVLRGRSGYVRAVGAGYVADATRAGTATAFHMRSFDLGKYLLWDPAERFLAAETSPLPTVSPVAELVTSHLEGVIDEAIDPVRDPLVDLVDALAGTADGALDPVREALRGTAVVTAADPSAAAEWVLAETPEAGAFTFPQAVDDEAEEDMGPADPTIARTLTVADDGTLSVLEGQLDGPATHLAPQLVADSRCATWPDIGTGVTGPQVTGATPYEQVRGYVDGHLHMMAYEFVGGRSRCGQPWHPYGVTAALVDCPDHEPGGYGALLEYVLSGQGADGHDTVGWPTFGYWPRYDSLTHEQVYYRWMERAWRGGLRMFTNLLVDNGVLCELFPLKDNSCNEMDGVRLQAQRLHELERYIDAEWGGPGEGWFRIVTDPFEARRVINSGRLAVVMGIEVSALFDCGERLGVPRCDADDLDAELAAVYDAGVRQMELVNKFDNGLTGVTGDSGTTGVVVNAGNFYETGHFWRMRTCADPDSPAHDHTQINPTDDGGTPDELTGRDALAGGILQLSGELAVAPLYPPGPHCNAAGLTQLGEHLLTRMAERGMVFDPDHMSASARTASLHLMEELGHPGLISSHSWSDETNYAQILSLGGVVTPYPRTADQMVETWRTQQGWRDERFTYGLGYGADTNGFGAQAPPREPAMTPADPGVTYPFTGMGGVTIDAQISGEQVYDINTDGVDHYGLYPDWIADIILVAEHTNPGDGARIRADLERSAEAYLQMWERAIGIAGDACRDDVDDLDPHLLGELLPGTSPEEVIVALGQPSGRGGTQFSYCTTDGVWTVQFDADGGVLFSHPGPGHYVR